MPGARSEMCSRCDGCRVQLAARLFSSASGHYKRDVVELFRSTELPNVVNKARKQGRWGQLPAPLQSFDEAFFSKLFSGRVECFRKAVRIEG